MGPLVEVLKKPLLWGILTLATHNLRSPLGSRKALQNQFAEQTDWLPASTEGPVEHQKLNHPAGFLHPMEHLSPKGEVSLEPLRGVPLF